MGSGETVVRAADGTPLRRKLKKLSDIKKKKKKDKKKN